MLQARVELPVLKKKKTPARPKKEAFLRDDDSASSTAPSEGGATLMSLCHLHPHAWPPACSSRRPSGTQPVRVWQSYARPTKLCQAQCQGGQGSGSCGSMCPCLCAEGAEMKPDIKQHCRR